MNPPIYLDHNGTTPIDPRVIAAMRPFIETEFGNPSSSHFFGERPRQAIALARSQVACLLGCTPEEIVFTSGGTESNNMAIEGAARAMKSRGNHIITSLVEHPAVLEVILHLETCGFCATYLPVDANGRVDVENVARAIRPETILISIMHANNEVGTIQPIARIAALARSKGIYVHTDAAQSAGKISVDVTDLGVDLMTLAGHKLYAPKGVGALYVRKGVAIEKFMHGAGQECGRRPGTENVMQIVGLGEACALAAEGLEAQAAHMLAMRERLHKALAARIDRIRHHGGAAARLPNTLSLAIEAIRAQALLEIIGPEVAVSAGAACHSDAVHISHVLLAMAVPPELALATVRLSTGRWTRPDQIDKAVDVLAAAVARLRSGTNGPILHH
jgi:cysteine desulfurase